MALLLFKEKRLRKAEKSLNSGKRTEAFKMAQPLIHAKSKEMAYRANRICGLALYHQKKHEDSLPYMKAACQLGNYKHDWYNLTMSLTFNGDFEEADDAFQNIYRTKVQPGYLYTPPTPTLLFQYMKALQRQGNTENAKKRANELKQMFSGVGTSNIDQQIARGLPAYPTFRDEIKNLYEPDELAKWEEQNH